MEGQRSGGESVLTIPMQFLRMLQMLKSFLENIGAGRLVLNEQRGNEKFRSL